MLPLIMIWLDGFYSSLYPSTACNSIESEAAMSPLMLMFKYTFSTYLLVEQVSHPFTIIASCCISSVFLSTLSSYHPEAILCDVGEFHCHDEKTCIPEAWLCDGEPDCPDDSDETDTMCKSLIPSISHWCKTVIKFCHSTSFVSECHLYRIRTCVNSIVLSIKWCSTKKVSLLLSKALEVCFPLSQRPAAVVI